MSTERDFNVSNPLDPLKKTRLIRHNHTFGRNLDDRLRVGELTSKEEFYERFIKNGWRKAIDNCFTLNHVKNTVKILEEKLTFFPSCLMYKSFGISKPESEPKLIRTDTFDLSKLKNYFQN